MAQVRFGHSSRSAGAVRAAARAAVSPRASPAFATSRVHASQQSRSFTSRLSTISGVNTTPHADCLRASKCSRCAPTQITRRRAFHATAAVQQDFSELSEKLDPFLLEKITRRLKHTSLTPLQSRATELLSPERPDAILQARSGSGKTLAYLMPTLQKVIERGHRKGRISALIGAPSRELAVQTFEMVQVLMKDHPEIGVKFVSGNDSITKKTTDLLTSSDIVVCTLNRLDEIVQNETAAKILSKVDTVVVDDLDLLNDQGRTASLHRLLQRIPKSESTPQTIITCVDLNSSVEEFAATHCRPGYKTISGPSNNEAELQDRRQLDLVEVPDFPSVFHGLVAYLLEEKARGGPLKAIVYGPTAGNLEIMRKLLKRKGEELPPVMACFGKHLGERSTTFKNFKQVESGILLTTPGSSRGLNYPGVTHVIRVGIPNTDEEFLDGLNHMAPDRPGALIVAEPEQKFVTDRMGRVQFTRREIDTSKAASSLHAGVSELVRLYNAWVPRYGRLREPLGWSDEELLRHANALADSLGAQKHFGAGGITALSERVIDSLGLDRNTPGLRIRIPKPKPESSED